MSMSASTSSSPLVSVVIPAYNAAAYIERAVDSVLQQTFSDYEVIVVDDGSTDDTSHRLAHYGSRIRYLFQENQERSAARNHGILNSKGRFIAFLDADDYWHPDKLSKQLGLVARHPEVALVYSWAQCFVGDRKLPRVLGQDFASTGGLDVFRGLLLGKSLPALTVLADRSAVIQAGLFDREIAIIEDWDLWLRLTMHGEVAVVPEVLAYYRLAGKYLPAAMARLKVPDMRVRSVERVLRSARESMSADLSSQLEKTALAHAWWVGCLVDYAVGDYLSGQRRLVRSIQYDPAFHFQHAERWLESLIAFASYLYDHDTPRYEAEAFLATFFDHLPANAQAILCKRRSAALGWLKAGYAFRMSDEGGREVESRELMREALRTYPFLVRNLGTVSISLRSTWLDRRKLMRTAARVNWTTKPSRSL